MTSAVICSEFLPLRPQLGSLLITVFSKWTDSYIYQRPWEGEYLFAWVFDSWFIKLGDSEQQAHAACVIEKNERIKVQV